MCLLFVMADSMYNLREENKQLRKAHHDIHIQLQDAQVRPNPFSFFLLFDTHVSAFSKKRHKVCAA